MITFVYHPLDPARVVEQEEADKLQSSGVWFDCPAKARAYRAKVEEEIKQDEIRANEAQAPTSKKIKRKGIKK